MLYRVFFSDGKNAIMDAAQWTDYAMAKSGVQVIKVDILPDPKWRKPIVYSRNVIKIFEHKKPYKGKQGILRPYSTVKPPSK